MTNLGYGMKRHDDTTTSLTDEELIGLRLRPTPSRDELNLIELTHITEVMDDSRWRALSTSQLLDDHELRRLHKDMFGKVWTWAGKYRTTEKNIGCDPIQISAQVRNLCESAKLWIDNGMPIDEVGYLAGGSVGNTIRLRCIASRCRPRRLRSASRICQNVN